MTAGRTLVRGERLMDLAPPTGAIREPDWNKLRLRLQAIGAVA